MFSGRDTSEDIMPLINGPLRFGTSEDGPKRLTNLLIRPLRGSFNDDKGMKELKLALRTRLAPSKMFIADCGLITRSNEDRGLRVCMKWVSALTRSTISLKYSIL